MPVPQRSPAAPVDTRAVHLEVRVSVATRVPPYVPTYLCTYVRNFHSSNSRLVSQEKKAKTFEVYNWLSPPKKAVSIRQCSTE